LTERSKIGSDTTVSFFGNLKLVNIGRKLHLLGVDVEDLKTTVLVWDSNIDFSIESTTSSECGVNDIRSVSSSDNDNFLSSLKSIHEGEHLRDNTLLNFTLRFLSVRSNGVKLIHEENSGRVFLTFFEGLSKVGFGFSSHLGHNFGSVQNEEECSGFVGNSSGDKSLTGSGGSEKKDTSWGLNSEDLKELRMSERKLNHFSNLGHLFAASADVIVTNLFSGLFVFTLNRLAFVKNIAVV
jgi:hypothetical protein